MATYDLEQTAALMERLRPTRMFIPALLGVLVACAAARSVALRWDDVKWESESLSITQSAEQTKAGVRYKETKSGKGRNVRLSQTVLQELKAWRVRQAEEFLRPRHSPRWADLCRDQGRWQPGAAAYLTHEWMRLVSNSELRRIRFHDLRHSHATHLLGSDVHPKIASERLGHSKVGITLDLYSHVMPGMQEDAVPALTMRYGPYIKTARTRNKLGSKMVANRALTSICGGAKS